MCGLQMQSSFVIAVWVSSDLIKLWDVVANIDKLVNVNDCKWARQTRLQRRCNTGFGGPDDRFFGDGGEGGPARIVDR